LAVDLICSNWSGRGAGALRRRVLRLLINPGTSPFAPTFWNQIIAYTAGRFFNFASDMNPVGTSCINLQLSSLVYPLGTASRRHTFDWWWLS